MYNLNTFIYHLYIICILFTYSHRPFTHIPISTIRHLYVIYIQLMYVLYKLIYHIYIICVSFLYNCLYHLFTFLNIVYHLYII